MAPSKTIIAFDLYGTLLSTASISKDIAAHFPDKADSIAATWRRYQLEYTFRLNSMSIYQPFDAVTRSSLEHTLAEHDVSLSPSEIDNLMTSYDSLSTFPDTIPGLKALAADDKLTAYVFSNGTTSMVSTSVQKSPSLAEHADIFKSLITVESVGCFKPSPFVYQHLVKSVGLSDSESKEVWLVSGNPFDVVGARAAGLQAAWVDRENKGWSDRLGDLASGGPTIIVSGVEGAVRGIKKWVDEHDGGE